MKQNSKEKTVQYLGVNAVGVENGAVVLLDANAGGACSVEVPHCVETDVTETLQTKFEFFLLKILQKIDIGLWRKTFLYRLIRNWHLLVTTISTDLEFIQKIKIKEAKF